MSDLRLTHEDEADRVIDRAVREIMSQEPLPGFRHRVLRRLEEPEPSRWTSFAARGFVGAAAVAGALTLAVWLRPAEGPAPASNAVNEPRIAALPTPAAPPSVAPRTPTVPSIQSASEPRRTPRSVSSQPQSRIVRAASLPAGDVTEEVTPAALPADATSAAIEATVDPAVPRLVIAPITLSDISITPLSAGGK